MNEARPCRVTDCRWYLEYKKPKPKRGEPEAAAVETPDVERASCVLDVADNGGATLEEVGELMGVTRERIRQIEGIALRKAQARGGLRPWWNP